MASSRSTGLVDTIGNAVCPSCKTNIVFPVLQRVDYDEVLLAEYKDAVAERDEARQWARRMKTERDDAYELCDIQSANIKRRHCAAEQRQPLVAPSVTEEK